MVEWALASNQNSWTCVHILVPSKQLCQLPSKWQVHFVSCFSAWKQSACFTGHFEEVTNTHLRSYVLSENCKVLKACHICQLLSHLTNMLSQLGTLLLGITHLTNTWWQGQADQGCGLFSDLWRMQGLLEAGDPVSPGRDLFCPWTEIGDKGERNSRMANTPMKPDGPTAPFLSLDKILSLVVSSKEYHF